MKFRGAMAPGLVLFPAVRFDPDFPRRVEAFARRFARAGLAAESAGSARVHGGGDDLQGLRAYRAGDDPRAIDWAASARAEGPLVRVLRRARGGAETIVLDASLSMAVGPPGKLQRAAEIAAALALLGARAGSIVTVIVLPHATRIFLDRRAGLPELLARLAGIEARGALGPCARVIPRCERATWIGDLAGVGAGEIARAAPRGTALRVLQVLGPIEIAPDLERNTTLVDPETCERLEAGPESLWAHARALEHQREAFARALRARGARFARASSAEPFEAACARLLTA